MQPLNFLRDAIRDLNGFLPSYKHIYPGDEKAVRTCLEKASRAEKFILPNKGRILDDDLKALPRELRLPFPVIVIEYTCYTDSIGTPERIFGKEETERAPKRIIIATQEEENIVIFSVVQYARDNGEKHWFFMPYAAMLKIDPFVEINGVSQVGFSVLPTSEESTAHEVLGDAWQENAKADLQDEVRAVVEFLEALSCSNVGFSERVSSAKPGAKQKKDKIPFDAYRVLTITVSKKTGPDESGFENLMYSAHASPREHVRRGHVRHYSSGLKIWINNTIVNPGTGGKISKVYTVK